MVSVISEIGVNWDGDFDVVREMITKSKNIGCDAVKFQSFDEKNLGNHPEKSKLLKCAINRTNIDKIDDIAKSVGIEWFCTPMNPAAVELIDPYVTKFKIRELDGRILLENKTNDIIDKILKTDKEVFVSSCDSPKKSKFWSNSRISWMYCVPKYPCDLSDLDFRNFEDFNGYSNHCPDFLAPLSAVLFGAKILEIHTTLDKTQGFVDNNVSYDFSELEKLMDLIHKCKKITTKYT